MSETLLNIPIDTLGATFRFYSDGAISVGDAIGNSGVEPSEAEARAKRFAAREAHEEILRGEKTVVFGGSRRQDVRRRQRYSPVSGE